MELPWIFSRGYIQTKALLIDNGKNRRLVATGGRHGVIRINRQPTVSHGLSPKYLLDARKHAIDWALGGSPTRDRHGQWGPRPPPGIHKTP